VSGREPETLGIARRVAGLAGPGEQVEAYVARGTSTTVRAYGGEVESLTQATSAGIGIRVVVDHREGFASAGTLDEAVIAEILAEARDNARFSEPEEWNGLAEPDGVQPPDLSLWSDEIVALSTQDKVDRALELERLARAGDPRISGVRTAIWSDGSGDAAVATSTGVEAWGRSSSAQVAVQALAEADGQTQIGAGSSAARSLDGIDLEAAAADAVERATRLLGAAQPPTQRLTLVFEPRLTATLVGIVGGMLTGEAVLKGRSPFADRVGEAIASPLLSFVDDATDARSLGADTHDGEGLACRPTPLVTAGVLDGFLHNSTTARRAGTVSTGSAVRGYGSLPGVGAHALAVEPGSGTFEDHVATLDLGLYVTSMSGLHSGVNPVSGDFSVGVEGLMIRNGALAEPVREATIASTLQRLLLDIAAVGEDLEWQPSGTGAVTVVIPDVALSGS
jgi:PmbA protein